MRHGGFFHFCIFIVCLTNIHSSYLIINLNSKQLW
nr:MAG TPA: hypothetical protein [Crassvirales sp.]